MFTPLHVQFPAALTPSSLLCSDLSAPHHPQWVSCREERHNSVRKKRGRFTAQGPISERQLSSFRKQAFFFSFHWGGGAFKTLCITTETIHKRGFYPFWSSSVPLYSTKNTHTCPLSFKLLLAAAAACLLACVFISGSSQHGRHVLCYCWYIIIPLGL